MKTQEVKTNIEVGGAILTQKAIALIVSLQEHDNYMVKDTSRVMADFICLVLQNRNSFVDAVQPKLDELLGDLASIRNNFEDLKKP